MNPSTAVSGLLVFCALTAAQGPPVTHLAKATYHFKMFHGGLQIGDASYERISSATDRRTLLTINETVEGLTLNAVFDTLIKSDGTPEKKSFHGVVGQRPFSSTAEFTPEGVKYDVEDASGGSTKGTLKPPANGVLADASETWFVKTMPKKGESVSFTNFNVQKCVWEQTKTTYVGDEATKVGKTTVTAHHVNVKSDGGEIEMYLDDDGDIVVMDQLGSLRLERAD